MIIDQEIKDNISKGVTGQNKSVTLILVSVALTTLYEMLSYHPEQTVLMSKINYYKALQTKLVKLTWRQQN